MMISTTPALQHVLAARAREAALRNSPLPRYPRYSTYNQGGV